MDLIEVLWKQDVDLGYSPTIPALNLHAAKEAEATDDVEKLKALLELKDKVSLWNDNNFSYLTVFIMILEGDKWKRRQGRR